MLLWPDGWLRCFGAWVNEAIGNKSHNPPASPKLKTTHGVKFGRTDIGGEDYMSVTKVFASAAETLLGYKRRVGSFLRTLKLVIFGVLIAGVLGRCAATRSDEHGATAVPAMASQILAPAVEPAHIGDSTSGHRHKKSPEGGPVTVHGYYRKDGTYVHGHTRSRPD